MKGNKIFGLLFLITAIVYCTHFMLQSEFNYRIEAYFDLNYLMQLLPLVIGFMLLYSGLLLFIKPLKANFPLALFGHTAVEEIIFNWLGFSKSYMSNIGIALFLVCGIMALWIAYTDIFNFKKLSITEAVLGFVFGTILALY